MLCYKLGELFATGSVPLRVCARYAAACTQLQLRSERAYLAVKLLHFSLLVVATSQLVLLALCAGFTTGCCSVVGTACVCFHLRAFICRLLFWQ
jgi:hypothetical protein